jgi:hypothetical protein
MENTADEVDVADFKELQAFKSPRSHDEVYSDDGLIIDWNECNNKLIWYLLDRASLIQII